MPVHTSLWTIGATPQRLIDSFLSKEALLEDMIVNAPQIISEEWMLIGRQEDTGFGGRIDLLAIAPDASLILVELKRDKTPRDVVAQAIDYAGWVENLKAEDIAQIYGRFAKGHNLADDFMVRFGHELDEDDLNQAHQIVIVSASLDASSERIVAYLNQRGISINVLCFQVFAHGNQQLLSRSWLLDPVTTQASGPAAPNNPKEPWNGEFYASFGHDGHDRSWEDAVEFGFISAGGGPWYTRTLQLLNPGDRVWVKIPKTGFVGVGRVTGPAQPAKEFTVQTAQGAQPVLEVAKRASYLSELADDPENCEYFLPVEWLQTVPIEQAVNEIGLFGNQNTVCKPTAPKWRFTVEKLKNKFSNWNA